MHIKGKWGTVYIMDCMDLLKKFKDKSIDLIFTDPPWGHEYDGKHPMGINAQVYKEDAISYSDNFDPAFNNKYFAECFRVAKRIVICMGWRNFNWWVANTNPRGYHFLIFKNGQGSTQVTKHNAVHPFLCYGDGFREWENKFHWNFTESSLSTLDDFLFTYSETFIRNGFLREKDGYTYKHPSPKPYEDIVKMIKELHPKNVVDIFAGSGSVAEACESLQIPYICSEISSYYVDDILYRIGRGQKRVKTNSLYEV